MFVLKSLIKKIDRSLVLKSVACSLVFMITLSISGFDGKCETVRENVLRLHVLANSDSEEDQTLKLKVRDALLTVSNEIFENCATENEAAEAARESKDLLLWVAQNTVRENGYSYLVSIDIAETWFETRDYDKFSLPAGNYEALRVVIGEGKGKNWWCVMFPAVCVPAASEKNNGFKNALNSETAEIVEQPERYKARFKVVEIFEKTRQKMSDWFF